MTLTKLNTFKDFIKCLTYIYYGVDNKYVKYQISDYKIDEILKNLNNNKSRRNIIQTIQNVSLDYKLYMFGYIYNILENDNFFNESIFNDSINKLLNVNIFEEYYIEKCSSYFINDEVLIINFIKEYSDVFINKIEENDELIFHIDR